MSFSRRDFIKTAGIALGAVTLPSWVYDAQASTDAYIDVNKDALADAALSTAKKLGASTPTSASTDTGWKRCRRASGRC